ncbi:MAG: DNA ligase-associated metallophosphoesterase [Roseibaca calidilacus]|uniref:Phosphoesterase n=1 Tax=Roseibaca calidilacus TaxID=1666912 RepID=A0A0P7VX38_9RHOB|nr:ligase-associated DNA damage response endonuclease PdeM [Roseibaca calidilacus]KPP91736.1 MAG: DNA ligase-associated metallophosphoesterase [Roseibaca calidilacus]CUX82604.1 putative phosphoesterase [Roseibaca calidilacus]
MTSFTFHSQTFTALPTGALHWPTQNALLVADLHLGKSERMARRGGALLPPYESQATLARLAQDLHATAATQLIALGDTFDDDAAQTALDPMARTALDQITTRHECHWVTGNHDPNAPGQASLTIGGLTLRHIAGNGPDISGHYHPKITLAGRRLPAFLLGTDHLILPAYGAYTGGLDADHPALATLIPDGCAITTGKRTRMVPLSRGSSLHKYPGGRARQRSGGKAPQ